MTALGLSRRRACSWMRDVARRTGPGILHVILLATPAPAQPARVAFDYRSELKAPHEASVLARGDFSGDGLPDLAVAGPGHLTVFEQGANSYEWKIATGPASQRTPVMAAAEGVVTFVGWNGGHGKAVIVRHRNGYGTLYGHLSGYGKGIQKGKKVDQGEIIGRVGSTGLSTGPHLHYTLMKNGKPTNPKNADVVRGDPLSNTFKNIFNEWVQKMNRYLEPPRIQQDRV